MAEIITYETLCEIRRDEKKSEKLAKIRNDFYESVEDYLSKGKQNNPDSPELRNARNILQDISERRERKILNQALLAIRSNGKPDLKAMTSREKELFNALIDVLEKRRISFFKKPKTERSSIREAPKKVKEVEKEHEEESIYTKVKILEDLPEIVGSDLENYGPFKEGDTVELPKENAEIFIEKSKAEEVTE